jgi:aminoglycoside phosphotransferase (APT) family kinase protein
LVPSRAEEAIVIEQLTAELRRHFSDALAVSIEGFEQIPGGFSTETYRFDCIVDHGARQERLPMILRKDPPPEADILPTDRALEHRLLNHLKANTGLPVYRSYLTIMDPAVLGMPAMVIERRHGSGQTSRLFNGGPDEAQAEDVVRHLCEIIAELHLMDPQLLNVDGRMGDPRSAGIDVSSWDRYMESTFQYYLDGYKDGDFEPVAVLMDAYLSLRRNRPRPLRLSLVHGDFNPANFLYEGDRVTANIDWENSHIGDPREDLGWMQTMDTLSNTSVMQYPKSEGGFLAYYNRLTGFGVTQDEVDYFALFGTCNIAVPVLASMKRRMLKEHMQFLHIYLIQPNVANVLSFARLLKYPGTV